MMLNEMMLFEDLPYLELSTQRPQAVMAIMGDVGKNYKADPRFKKHTFLEPLDEESNHTSIEVVRLPATVGKNVIRLFQRKGMCLLEPLKMIKIYFRAHRNKCVTKKIDFM